MAEKRTSLRTQIDKWLAPTLLTPLHVAQFGRTTNGGRYVSIAVLRADGPLTIAFFRHEDGAWCVFPPRVRQRWMMKNA